jgi:hypothetical protein
MKAKRRQELKANDLAAWLDEVWRSASKWGWYVGGGLAVILAIVAINAYRTSARAEARTSAYAELRKASSLQVAGMAKTDEEVRASLNIIDDLVSTSTDDAFRISALNDKAFMAMRLAQRALAEPVGADAPAAQRKEDVMRYLDEARSAYERVVREHADHALYAGRASFGLFEVEATAFVADGDTARRERAEQHLKRVLDNPALNGTPLQTVAIGLLNDLDAVFTQIEFPARPAVEPTPPTPAPTTLGPLTPEVLQQPPGPDPLPPAEPETDAVSEDTEFEDIDDSLDE